MAFAHEMKGYAEKKPLNFCCPLCFFEDNSEKKFSAHYEKCLVLWTKNNKEKMNQEPKPEVNVNIIHLRFIQKCRKTMTV